MKTFKTIALLLVGTVSSLLLMGCGEITPGRKHLHGRKRLLQLCWKNLKRRLYLEI